MIFNRAMQHPDRIAIRQGDAWWRYDRLLAESGQLAKQLIQRTSDLTGKRIAFLSAPGYDHIRVQWAIWQSGAIAVPLCIDHPVPSLQYILDDTGATILLYGDGFEELASALTIAGDGHRIPIPPDPDPTIPAIAPPDVAPELPAMILHTSGTTSKPKGVVLTHGNLATQMGILEEAWGWSADDEILCVLPLHHIHGLVNVVGCALWSGACCRFLEEHFSADAFFDAVLKTEVNVFMAVPTIYFKLITAWEGYDGNRKRIISDRLRRFRLMVSGSAALPVSVMEKWETISGHRLLERYGMTEIGMALSNPYQGQRRAGSVGTPLPGVSVRLCDEHDNPVGGSESGEIQVKGANVFHQYWNKPEATASSFTGDGWFRTGDVAVVEDGYYRILGRNSVDIIKSGGYKLSALEIEEVLRTHPAVSDCCVVGLPDEEWGETVAAAIIARTPVATDELKNWMRERMPAYRTPRRYLMVDSLPRNAMGKVMKPDVKELFNRSRSL